MSSDSFTGRGKATAIFFMSVLTSKLIRTEQIFDTCIVDPKMPARDFKGVQIELYDGDGDSGPDVTLRNQPHSSVKNTRSR